MIYRIDQPLVYQSDVEFSSRPLIQQYGCYFLAIIRSLSNIFEIPFTHKSVMEFYDTELDNGRPDIQEDTYIENPQNVADDLIGRGKVVFLNKRLPPDYECGPDEIEIGCFHKEGKDFVHFVHMNEGRVVYDPWSAWGSISAREGRLIAKYAFCVLI